MKFDKDLLEKPWFAMTFAACAGVLFYMLLSHLHFFFGVLQSVFGFLKPVLLGAIIAYVMDPLVTLIERRVLGNIRSAKVRHDLAVWLSLIVVLLFMIILMVALIPQLIDSVVTFFGNADTYARTARQLLAQLSVYAQNMNFDISGLVKIGNDLLAAFTSAIPRNINTILHTSMNIGLSFANVVIGVIMAIYFLSGKKNIKAGFRRLMHAILPPQAYKNVSSFAVRCNRILIRYIACDLLDGLIVGVANWLFMLLMNMPYSVLISVVVGVTNLAPTFGPIAAAAIGAFILVLAEPVDALVFLIFTLILQTLDGYVIKPKLFGDQLGVSAIWILVSLIFFGRMFGVAGILLAIPIAAILDYVYSAMILRRLEKHKKEQT